MEQFIRIPRQYKSVLFKLKKIFFLLSYNLIFAIFFHFKIVLRRMLRLTLITDTHNGILTRNVFNTIVTSIRVTSLTCSERVKNKLSIMYSRICQ